MHVINYFCHRYDSSNKIYNEIKSIMNPRQQIIPSKVTWGMTSILFLFFPNFIIMTLLEKKMDHFWKGLHSSSHVNVGDSQMFHKYDSMQK